MTAVSRLPERATDEPSSRNLVCDVLVIGGGPAGVWAALTAAEAGAKVVLADKGMLGTSGATAAGNTTMIHAAPGSEEREGAIQRRLKLAFGLADRSWIELVIDDAYRKLNQLADWGYAYPVDAQGRSFRGSLRGVDYLRFMRRRLRKAGVLILDQSPALELLVSEGVVAGAAGLNRQTGEGWTARAGAVVVATGGSTFLSKALGTNALTGDGYLMAAEAGAIFSGMEFTGHYGISTAFSSVTKGIMFSWATFTDEGGNVLEGDRQAAVANHLLKGKVFAVIDQASPWVQEGMRKGQPNMFLPFDRMGIDPFRQRFEIVLRYEGTVRGVGGLLVDRSGATTTAGLYAAGDAASRESLVGATTGGGGPNASWAMVSGAWAGRSAASFAQRLGRNQHTRNADPAGGAGLRPSRGRRTGLTPNDLMAVVQDHILPLDRSYFRTGPRLAESLDRIEELWTETRAGLSQPGVGAVEARETAAMVATARWILHSAIERRETRGMHRRLDAPSLDPGRQHRLHVGGLDRVWVRPDFAPERAIAS